MSRGFIVLMNEAIEVLKDEILNKRLSPEKASRIQEGIAELLIREGSCIEGYSTGGKSTEKQEVISPICLVEKTSPNTAR